LARFTDRFASRPDVFVTFANHDVVSVAPSHLDDQGRVSIFVSP